MALVVDTGPLLALVDRADDRHEGVLRFLRSTDEPMLLSPFVLAEADYLVGKRMGVTPAVKLLADVVRGDFLLEPISASDIRACAVIVERYRDLAIGLTDASLVVLAGRHRTRRLLTFDERHFRTVRAPDGEPFTILPADSSPGR